MEQPLRLSANLGPQERFDIEQCCPLMPADLTGQIEKQFSPGITVRQTLRETGENFVWQFSRGGDFPSHNGVQDTTLG
jgi:hypothetical protein